jgi:hypothetical protein
MARYRLHRIRTGPGENFRWAPHTGGVAVVKPKDYELGEEVEGDNPYAVWKLLQSEGRALRAGDLLETITSDEQVPGSGEIRIAKYIGFEPAKWWVPEPKPGDASSAPEASAEPVPAGTQPGEAV